MDALRTDAYLALAKAINCPDYFVRQFKWQGDSGLQLLQVTVYGHESVPGHGRPAAVVAVDYSLFEGEEPDVIAELYAPAFEDALRQLTASVR